MAGALPGQIGRGGLNVKLMALTIRTFSDAPGEFSVTAAEADSIEAVANGRIEGDAMILTFIAVRDGLRKKGLGSEILRRFRDEAVGRGLKRFIGENVRSRAVWRVLGRVFGEPHLLAGCHPDELPEQPERVIFAPSLGLLQVESKPELTAEWRF